jgi:mono/diheme cytochrome c family protein
MAGVKHKIIFLWLFITERIDMSITSIIQKNILLLAIFNIGLFQTSANAEMSQYGESISDLYIDSCAACHGVDGKGNGPMFNQLTRQPKDLTVLSQENGGSFPETVVYQIIDGRRINLSHGSREMPVWGKRFRMSGENEDAVEKRITSIIKYIESIQN